MADDGKLLNPLLLNPLLGIDAWTMDDVMDHFQRRIRESDDEKVVGTCSKLLHQLSNLSLKTRPFQRLVAELSTELSTDHTDNSDNSDEYIQNEYYVTECDICGLPTVVVFAIGSYDLAAIQLVQASCRFCLRSF
jgi:hypothetical protein